MAMQTISIEEATRRIREGAHIDAMDPDGPAAHPGLRAALDDALIAELEAGRIIAGWDEEKQQLGFMGACRWPRSSPAQGAKAPANDSTGPAAPATGSPPGSGSSRSTPSASPQRSSAATAPMPGSSGAPSQAWTAST